MTVSCASSLQDVVREIARHYEAEQADARIHVNSGGSQLLARQIEEGAPVDLFISADVVTIERLVVGRLIDSSTVRIIARNRVVVVAPADRIPEVGRVTALASPRIRRIALSDSTVPIGRYAMHFLRRVGLLDGILPRSVRTENVRASLAAAATGAVDLAFVYATDARLSDSVVIVWEVAPELTPPVVAYVGRVRESNAGRAANAFLDYLLTPDSQAVFEAAGFLPPSDDGR